MDPITQYIIEQDKLEELKNIGYMGKYASKTTQMIRDMGKDPNGLSFLRFTRGQTVMGAKIAAGVAAVVLIGVSIKVFKRYATQTGKACKDYKPSSYRYKRCSLEVRIMGKKKQLAFLSTKVSECKNTKDPSKCVSKTKKYIEKVKNQIKEMEGKKSQMIKRIAQYK